MLTSIKPRFILDVYQMAGTQVVPLNELDSHRFCTKDQANEIVKLLPAEAADPTIVDNTGSFSLPTFTNYRDDSDPSNLYCLAVRVNVKAFIKYDEQSGAPVYTPVGPVDVNIGWLLFSKPVGSDKLVVDKIGQLVWG